MTMLETIRDIIDTGSAIRAAAFASKWRHGMKTKFGIVTATHADIMGMVTRAGRDPAAFEALLYEHEALESSLGSKP